MAKLHGATEAEIEAAVGEAKCTTGWSTYLNGLQMDFEEFKKEVTSACDHVRAMGGAGAEMTGTGEGARMTH